MKNFTSINDVKSPLELVQQTLMLKRNPGYSTIGRNKTLGLIFFNPSLRTRISMQKAASNLGMNVIMMNINRDFWNIEFEDGSIMNGANQEHIKDAVKVISSYCDIIGVRTFAKFKNRRKDYEEEILAKFLQYSSVPVISLESATLHPLQSLADLATIADLNIQKPKVVLSWAPHPKVLPQAVANSFLQWITCTNADVTLAHPEGYELKENFTNDVEISNDQDEAFAEADIVYAKNWSSYSDYGQIPTVKEDWIISSKKMKLTKQGKFMHSLPIRRNVIATDKVIDNSLVYQQAKNREYAAQAVLQNLLEDL